MVVKVKNGSSSSSSSSGGASAHGSASGAAAAPAGGNNSSSSSSSGGSYQAMRSKVTQWMSNRKSSSTTSASAPATGPAPAPAAGQRRGSNASPGSSSKSGSVDDSEHMKVLLSSSPQSGLFASSADPARGAGMRAGASGGAGAGSSQQMAHRSQDGRQQSHGQASGREYENLFDGMALQSLSSLQQDVLQDNVLWEMEIKNLMNRYHSAGKKANGVGGGGGAEVGGATAVGQAMTPRSRCRAQSDAVRPVAAALLPGGYSGGGDSGGGGLRRTGSGYGAGAAVVSPQISRSRLVYGYIYNEDGEEEDGEEEDDSGADADGGDLADEESGSGKEQRSEAVEGRERPPLPVLTLGDMSGVVDGLLAVGGGAVGADASGGGAKERITKGVPKINPVEVASLCAFRAAARSLSSHHVQAHHRAATSLGGAIASRLVQPQSASHIRDDPPPSVTTHTSSSEEREGGTEALQFRSQHALRELESAFLAGKAQEPLGRSTNATNNKNIGSSVNLQQQRHNSDVLPGASFSQHSRQRSYSISDFRPHILQTMFGIRVLTDRTSSRAHGRSKKGGGGGGSRAKCSASEGGSGSGKGRDRSKAAVKGSEKDEGFFPGESSGEQQLQAVVNKRHSTPHMPSSRGVGGTTASSTTSSSQSSQSSQVAQVAQSNKQLAVKSSSLHDVDMKGKFADYKARQQMQQKRRSDGDIQARSAAAFPGDGTYGDGGSGAGAANIDFSSSNMPAMREALIDAYDFGGNDGDGTDDGSAAAAAFEGDVGDLDSSLHGQPGAGGRHSASAASTSSSSSSSSLLNRRPSTGTASSSAAALKYMSSMFRSKFGSGKDGGSAAAADSGASHAASADSSPRISPDRKDAAAGGRDRKGSYESM
jgi:hypothetical protein